jgi:glycosyltransferase involved in cell wall biosynthesis
VGGVPEAVLEGVTGMLVPPDRPEALAGALGQLLRNPGLVDRMSVAARHRVEQQFSAQRFADAVQELYGCLLAEQSFWRTAA